MERTIGVIGTGNMGAALVRGLVSSGTDASRIVVYDALEEAVRALTSELGVSAAGSNAELAAQSDVIVLAVKPKDIPSVLEETAGSMDDGKLVVSIAAGVTTSSIERALASGGRTVRVMPNTPLQIGKGASAYARGAKATGEDADFVGEMLSRFGVAVEVEENLMDAVTGLSGSGPAYVYLMIEALVEGAVKMGMAGDTALRLAAQTVVGAGAMVLETGMAPEDLRKAVMSPGGTTVEGLRVLDEAGFREALADAVRAATERSRELGGGK
jgi:pyrroline-5-carboxylate reductase